jgi:pyridoxine kinase
MLSASRILAFDRRFFLNNNIIHDDDTSLDTFTNTMASPTPLQEQSRILSIQSHVVHGYVGNKAAVFPLQLLGFDVDFINSVQFASHTGYAHFPFGQVMNGDQLREILQGLRINGLLHNTGYLLTGYIGSISFLEAVLEVLHTCKQHNPNVTFVCDPVLGDDGKFYVDPQLAAVYREKVIPKADVVTPNQFEVEQLTGLQVRTLDDAKNACRILHNMGPSIVFITSVVLEDHKNIISIVASNKCDGDGSCEMWKIDCPKIPGSFTGTGDVTASLLLGHLAKQEPLQMVMEKVVNTMYVLIQKTHLAKGDTVQSKELKLIQSKNDIENPPSTYKPQRL